MNKLICIILFFVFLGCGIHPKSFSKHALDEQLVTIDNDSISFRQILSKNKGKKMFIQIFASYCPVSHDSFRDVLKYQKKYPETNYIFLSVDHTFQDWKRGLKYVKPKGQFYYIPKKGKGVLGSFLKLKSIPRFLIVDKKENIKVFKASKINENLK